MVDKKEAKALAGKLFFEIDDKLAQKIIDYISDSIKQLNEFKDLVKEDTPQMDYPRVKNCAVLRKDVPEKKEGDYLSNAKTADKYVVGK